MKDRKMSFYNRIVKRMLDIICSLAAIMCLSVLYLPICAIIKCTSGPDILLSFIRVSCIWLPIRAFIQHYHPQN